FEGRTYDVWAIAGMHQRFVRWLARKAGPDRARLAVENGWFAGERQAVREIVEFLVHPAEAARHSIDFTLTLEAVGPPVEIAGREKKGYGGLGIRFAPRQGTEIYTERGMEAVDSDQVPHPWAELAATPASAAVDAAIAATGPDTIVKFLFTSGSTKAPKAVINTQRMWCANQQQMAQSMPVLAEEDLVLMDWLPWNHTFGGNHNFGMVLYHGGTLYIDDGKPTPALIHETLRNLREIAPTVYFNVPVGFEAIANAMQTDAVLRRNLLSRVRMLFYAGAALAQPVWDSLYASEVRELGVRIPMTSGLGMTETSPFALFVTSPEVRAGDLGLPTPGLEVKLVDVDGKTEVRYRGPNVTPGYWRNPDETAAAFDEEGFFRSGDAVAWIDETDVHRGLRFDGRIAEDFKLATGTFVSVGPLRARIIAAGAPYVQDVVITGLNRHDVGALVFPTARVRELAPLPPEASLHEVLEHVRDDRLSLAEACRVTKPGGRIVIYCPNRLYPFETHGIFLGKRYVFGNIPLVNYLPRRWRDRLAPHVRVYTAGDLQRLFAGLPVRVVQRSILFGAYDNIIARLPALGKVLRAVLQALETTPLRVLGLSHFWVIEKIAEGSEIAR
ncbi:AMP-binding protein, partial [uncultured Anaerolinea sp.]|uniref:AMP-binding protein n=1 Tax=uncultured Anaerolinea sp. TaxID=430695 RepID=UPI00261CB899